MGREGMGRLYKYITGDRNVQFGHILNPQGDLSNQVIKQEIKKASKQAMKASRIKIIPLNN